jgi:Haloacid dehalogenase-like hydrolase
MLMPIAGKKPAKEPAAKKPAPGRSGSRPSWNANWSMGQCEARSLRPWNTEMPKATIFDLDGTLLDSMDLHAIAWHEAMVEFGHDVSFEQARSQIGKGGDKLIPVFLSADRQRAAIASRPSICRSSIPSRRSPTYCDARAMPDFGSPSLPRPRRMNSKSTSTSRASPTWWT